MSGAQVGLHLILPSWANSKTNMKRPQQIIVMIKEVASPVRIHTLPASVCLTFLWESLSYFLLCLKYMIGMSFRHHVPILPAHIKLTLSLSPFTPSISLSLSLSYSTSITVLFDSIIMTYPPSSFINPALFLSLLSIIQWKKGKTLIFREVT